MSGLSQPEVTYYSVAALLTQRNCVVGAVAIFFALYPFERTSLGLGSSPLAIAARGTGALALLALSIALLSVHSFNPFIYFRF